MLPVRAAQRLPARRDPAPSRLRYRLNRLWLRPGFRRLVNFGVPMLAGVAAAWTISAEIDLEGRALAAVERVREAIVDRPQFVITTIAVPDVSRDLAEAIRVAAFVQLPVVEPRARRRRACATASSRSTRSSGCGCARWRAACSRSGRSSGCRWWSGARPTGLRAARPGRRARRRDRQPGAPARPAADRRRRAPTGRCPRRWRCSPRRGRSAPASAGWCGMGERRWDLVLDRDQVVKLPEAGPIAALEPGDGARRRATTC